MPVGWVRSLWVAVLQGKGAGDGRAGIGVGFSNCASCGFCTVVAQLYLLGWLVAF